jgi:hypothetical protein
LGRQTTYISSPGNFTSAVTFPTATTTQSWYFLSALEVFVKPRSVAVVTLGDSITDGFASTVDANRRWPNVLAERLQESRRFAHIAVMDQGISGNRVLHDTIGPNALSRVDRRPRSVGCQIRDAAGRHQRHRLFGFIPNEECPPTTSCRIPTDHHARPCTGLLIYGCTLTPFGGLGPP